MDKLSSARRSENMRQIRNKDTKPELLVRRVVYGLGYRYRLHKKNLPGKPDLVFTKLKRIIFIHGCFWHQHSQCREGRVPNSRQEYWIPKLERNTARDKENIRKLKSEGWKVMTIWECQTLNLPKLQNRINRFLRDHYPTS